MEEFSFDTVRVDRRGQVVSRETSQAQRHLDDLDNGVALAMVAIPGGEFTMGAPQGQGYDDERPQHSHDSTIRHGSISHHPGAVGICLPSGDHNPLFGEMITTELATYCGVHTYGSGPVGIYRHVTTDVGSFPPNAFGLNDMHGNVWEWCADAWHSDYTGAPADGQAWEADGRAWHRVARGGSWHDGPDLARSATRLRAPAIGGEELMGFRVTCG